MNQTRKLPRYIEILIGFFILCVVGGVVRSYLDGFLPAGQTEGINWLRVRNAGIGGGAGGLAIGLVSAAINWWLNRRSKTP